MSTSNEIIQHIIQEIVSLATPTLDEEFLHPKIATILTAYMIRALVLNPENGFDLDKEFGKDDFCVAKLSDKSAAMETIRMQVFFDSQFPIQHDTLQKSKTDYLRTLEATKTEVLEAKPVKPIEMEVVQYIMRRNPMSTEMDLKDIRESTAALESVFPTSELKSFVSSPKTTKEKNLEYWTSLVVGIRLFNKELGKGGENITEVFKNCQKMLQDLIMDVSNMILTCDMYSASLTENKRQQKRNPTTTRILQTITDLRRVSQETEKKLTTLQKANAEVMKDLKNICRSRSAVPVEQVYPFFISLSKMWDSMNDELFLLHTKDKLMKRLDKSFQCVSGQCQTKPSKDSLPIFPKNSTEKNVNQVVSNATQIATDLLVVNKTIEVVHPGNFTQFYAIVPQFSGFCAHALLEGNGVVMPGDKALGMIKYKDKLFAFSSKQGFHDFATDPEKYTVGVIELAKRQPHLIQLLQLYNYFPTIEALEKTKSYGQQRLLGQKPMISECGTQVDTHIVDSIIDKTYHWNEWELRRKAIMLVNLKNKVTHSSQTHVSHFKRDSETQHYALKSAVTQTLKETGTKATKTTTFMQNIRKDPASDKKFRVFDFIIE